MGLRILAVVAEAKTTPTCLSAAMSVAERLPDCEIEAIHVVTPQSASFEEAEAKPVNEAEATRAAFEIWMSAHSFSTAPLGWRERTGSEIRCITDEARDFDVLVLASPLGIEASNALHAALFETGRPFFLIPSFWAPREDEGFPNHIAIAWTDTAGCLHAIDGIAPWLKRALRVTLILAHAARHAERAAKTVLRGHGIDADVHLCSHENGSIADQLIEQTQLLGSDLLVMGAYSQAGRREWMLGGTTQQMLAQAAIPLFMAR